MRNEYTAGLADTHREFNAIAEFAAGMPHTYGSGLREWAYGKLRYRMENELAVPYPALYGKQVVAVTVAYPEPPTALQPMPGVEVKLWRTAAEHLHWGQGRATLKGAFNEACRQMELEPGTNVRIHLDTRSSAAMPAFEAVGFQKVGETVLYDADPDLPDQTDVLYEKIAKVPANLYDRPAL